MFSNKKALVSLVVAASMLALGGCAQLAKDNSNKLEKGTHKLSVMGNVFDSREVLQAKIDEKAARLCGGEDKYEYIDGEVTMNAKSEVKVEGSYSVYSRVLKCQ